MLGGTKKTITTPTTTAIIIVYDVNDKCRSIAAEISSVLMNHLRCPRGPGCCRWTDQPQGVVLEVLRHQHRFRGIGRRGQSLLRLPARLRPVGTASDSKYSTRHGVFIYEPLCRYSRLDDRFLLHAAAFRLFCPITLHDRIIITFIVQP